MIIIDLKKYTDKNISVDIYSDLFRIHVATTTLLMGKVHAGQKYCRSGH